MKRIILAAVGAAVVGLTACSHTATPTAAPASHGTVRVPVSCRQQYNTWKNGHGQKIIAALSAVSSAETAGDPRLLAMKLKKARPTVSSAVHHPVPACADPGGYWDVLLMHVAAAAKAKASASSVRAAMKEVPRIEHQLTVELKQTAQKTNP